MIDIKILRERAEEMKENIILRNLDPKKYNIELILELDQKRKEKQKILDGLKAERNKLTQEISRSKGNEREELIKKAKEIKEKIDIIEKEFEDIEKELINNLWQLPNFLLPDTPRGKNENDNIEIKRWKEPKKFPFQPLDHLELAIINDLVDFERGSKVAGSNFYYLKNEAVILEFALLQFVIDQLLPEGLNFL